MADNNEFASAADECGVRPQKAGGWRRFLVIYAVVFLLLGAAGCVALYRYAAAYEASIPEHVMDELMAQTTEEQWYELILADTHLAVSELEDADALIAAYCEAALRGQALSYRKTPGLYSEDSPVYTVRGGGKNLCTVTLVPEGSGAAGFGRELWRVGEIRSCLTADELESVTVVVDAPAGEPVWINGQRLQESFRTGETVAPPNLTALESRFAEPPAYERWRVDAMYGEIVVEDKNGTPLSPLREENGAVIHYVAGADALHSLTVIAPEGVTVLAGGAELPLSEAVETEEEILLGLESFIEGDVPKQRTWHYEGLYTVPEVIGLSADGSTLKPLMNAEGELRFFPPEDEALKEAVEPFARTFFERYVTYSSNAYDEGLYIMLLTCILPDSELYRYVQDSKDAMVWASTTTVSYDELSFSDFHSVSDRCFTCTIRYKANFDATTWYESYSYDLQNAYEMAFVLQDWSWLAAAMSVIAG